TLAAAHTRATFFFIGQWASDHPELVRQIAAAGHELGNHTQTHEALTKISDAEAMAEIATAHETVAAIAGRPPSCFRLPMLEGDADANIDAIIRRAGYRRGHTRENADSVDWRVGRTASEAFARVLSDADRLNPVVILMHSWPE